MNTISKLIKKYSSIILFIIFLAQPVSASQLSWQSQGNVLSQNETWQLDLMVMPDEQAINVVAGTVTYPSNLLELVDDNDGNSIITLWVEKESKVGSFTFSGVIPGGFSGVLNPNYQTLQPGKVVSLFFKAKANLGQGQVDLSQVQVLLNDGAGTADKVRLASQSFTIDEQAVSDTDSQEYISEDYQEPEYFNVKLINDPNLFNGQWVAIFATQDKGSGLDYFKIKEGDLPFVEATSPYVLQLQDLSKDITVIAVDKAGNERVSALSFAQPSGGYENYLIWVIIILTLIIIAGAIIFILDRKKYGGRRT